jgi:hypothetical protein
VSEVGRPQSPEGLEAVTFLSQKSLFGAQTVRFPLWPYSSTPLPHWPPRPASRWRPPWRPRIPLRVAERLRGPRAVGRRFGRRGLQGARPGLPPSGNVVNVRLRLLSRRSRPGAPAPQIMESGPARPEGPGRDFQTGKTALYRPSSLLASISLLLPLPPPLFSLLCHTCSLRCWGLNSGLSHQHLRCCVCVCVMGFFKVGFPSCFPRLASNRDPPHFCLLSS